MQRTHITLLGSFALRQHNMTLTSLRSRRALAVLVYLLMRRQPVTRQTLLQMVWADKPLSDAKSNLSWALGYLSTVMPDCITRSGDVVAIAPDAPLDVDVWALWDDGELDWQQAGPLLDGFYLAESAEFELWLLRSRETVRETLRNRLFEQANRAVRRSQIATATQLADRIITLDPWDEAGYRLSMTLLARQQKHEAAAAQYQRLAELLSAELGTTPAAATTALHTRIKRLQQQQRLHLPAQPTPFVGRSAGVTQIAHALAQQEPRLLTLHGVGGMGKTRLAIEAARTSQHAFLDGIHFIPLVGSSDLAQTLVTTLVQRAAIPPAPDSNLWQHLQAQLAQREMLLLLDNFETLITQTPALTTLLSAAPELKLLITSRIQLNTSAEQVIVIDGMTHDDAAALFEQATAFVRPHLPLQPAEQADAARICALLEGMPLGVELAASWLRVRSVDDVLAGLSQTLSDLTTTMRDMPTRHRSMQAVFDYSWSQLTADARTALAKLAVFKDPFTAALAADVADAGRAVLTVLQQHALLRGAGQMQLHPLINEFARAKLNSAEKHHITDRHLTYFDQLITQHANAFASAEQQAGVQTFTRHHNDLQHAWSHALATHRWAAADRMLPILDAYYAKLNRYAESQANAQAFATALRLAGTTDYLGHALAYAVDWNLDDGTVMPDRIADMQALCEADGRPQVLTIAYFQLANLANNRHDYAAAWELGEQLFQHALQAEMGRFMVSGLLLQANVSIPQRLNRPKVGQAKFRQALDVAQTNGDKGSEAIVRHNIGFYLQYTGDYGEAEVMFAEVDALQTELGSPVLACTAMMMQVRAIAAQGRLREAETLALQALDRARALTFPILIMQLLTVLATEIYPQQKRFGRAVTLATFASNHPDCSPQVKLHLDEYLPGISAELAPPERTAALSDAQHLTIDSAIAYAARQSPLKTNP